MHQRWNQFMLISVCESQLIQYTLLNVIIRDLKPTNVLLEENDKPVLMDLGSMNKARIEVKGSREAMTVQVGGEIGRPVNWLIDAWFL